MRSIKHFVPIILGMLVLSICGCSKKDDDGVSQTEQETSPQSQRNVRPSNKPAPQGVKAALEQGTPRNLWELWEETSIPLSKIAGMTWDGKALWVLDPTSKTICRLGSNGEIAERLQLSMQQTPTGLASDGEAFWTLSLRAKRIFRLGKDGSQTSFMPV